MSITKIKNFLLDLFFPRKCFGCNKDGVYLCEDCFKSILINKTLTCDHPVLDGLLVASDSKNPLLRQLIYKYKYGSFVKDMSKPLGKILIKFLENKLTALSNPILIPIPLSKRRLHWRGFNQAELLSQELKEHFSIPIINNILKRAGHRRPQMEIKNALARRQNIKGAFKLSTPSPLYTPPSKGGWRKKGSNFLPLPEGGGGVGGGGHVCDHELNEIKNKTIILVDDIATTSATLQEAAQALKPLKPKKIFGLVLCRG